jgi:hypothetical protein
MEREKAGEIWNDICFHINRHRHSPEKDLQKNIEILYENSVSYQAGTEELMHTK